MKKNNGYKEYRYALKEFCKENDVEIKAPVVGIGTFDNKVYLCSFSSSVAILSMYEPVESLFVMNRKGGCMPIEFPVLAAFSAEHRALRGKATHYFIESTQLADFFVKSTPIFTDEIIDIIACSVNGIAVTEAVIHTPNDSFIFRYYCVDKTKKPLLTISDGKQTGSFFLDKEIEGRCKLVRISYLLKLTFGMCLYMHCFPNAIKDGVPGIQAHLKPRMYRRSKSVVISEVNDVIDRTLATPHYRRGHFRVLSSDKYTKKRGHVVFVKETFVLGKAKTITDSEHLLTTNH